MMQHVTWRCSWFTTGTFITLAILDSSDARSGDLREAASCSHAVELVRYSDTCPHQSVQQDVRMQIYAKGQ